MTLGPRVFRDKRKLLAEIWRQDYAIGRIGLVLHNHITHWGAN